MADLEYISSEDLQRELDRRKQDNGPIPQQLEKFDFTKLIGLCQLYIDDLSGQGVDDDLEHYIFEEAMQSVFGTDVWKWINKRL